MTLRVVNVCQHTNADEMWNLRLKRPRHQLWLTNANDPAPLEEQAVAMLTAMSGESPSAKRGTFAGADGEERARLRLRSEGKRGQKHDMEDIVELKAKAKARLEPRRSVKGHNFSWIWRRRKSRIQL